MNNKLKRFQIYRFNIYDQNAYVTSFDTPKECYDYLIKIGHNNESYDIYDSVDDLEVLDVDLIKAFREDGLNPENLKSLL